MIINVRPEYKPKTKLPAVEYEHKPRILGIIPKQQPQQPVKVVEEVQPQPTEPINYEEDKVQARLSAELQGQREVMTPAGYIDVLTETEVIEVKSAHNWKHAIGQVIVYGSYFPTRQKRIHLFGDVDNLSLIEQHCTPLNIKVTTND